MIEKLSQVNYETRHKFTVSIGVFFILLPVVLVSYILANSTNLFVYEQSKYAVLSPFSKDILKFLKCSVPVFCVTIFFFGVCFGIKFISDGLKDWEKFEKIDLEDRNLELKKKKTEFNKILEEVTQKEKDAAIEKEADNFEKSNHQYLEKYRAIENAVIRRLFETNTENYNIVTNKRIGGVIYDVVAFSNTLLKKDIVFEIKYIKRFQVPLYKSYIKQMKKLAQTFSENTNHIPDTKLVLVTNKEVFAKVKSFVDKQEKSHNFSVIVITEDLDGEINFWR
ncbi:TPA: hypothetical protein U1C79_000669 [Streptococcus suis]|uniref:hypothetical protein n=1 Tax=Streptococcus suis TaxID=1307 RepID=UPI002AA30248|nr:hypothetical protein [Streptococcus suis]HEM3675266.1 hypothetical protein [Streptococcus suis]